MNIVRFTCRWSIINLYNNFYAHTIALKVYKFSLELNHVCQTEGQVYEYELFITSKRTFIFSTLCNTEAAQGSRYVTAFYSCKIQFSRFAMKLGKVEVEHRFRSK